MYDLPPTIASTLPVRWTRTEAVVPSGNVVVLICFVIEGSTVTGDQERRTEDRIIVMYAR